MSPTPLPTLVSAFGGLTSSCFNAFSRVDVRVEVRIPGGVDAYVVDLRGERHEATPEIWQETYLSALLRAIRYADDASYRLAGYRKLDPITTVEGEVRFLKAAEELFFNGTSKPKRLADIKGGSLAPIPKCRSRLWCRTTSPRASSSTSPTRSALTAPPTSSRRCTARTPRSRPCWHRATWE